jgi:hypothetical protein
MLKKIWPVHLVLILMAILFGAMSSIKNLPFHDFKYLQFTNLFLYLIGIISLFLQDKAIGVDNPNIFLRSVLGGTMLKMFGMVIWILGYVMWKREDYDAYAILVSLFVYLIYLGIEVFWMMKQYRKKHAQK